ncbi:MAG: hypothetical protein IJ523_12715 [Succinivibrionaceae bacterium]|nr:hypothetical protein [Succinivibrionaceae bacterium]
MKKHLYPILLLSCCIASCSSTPKADLGNIDDEKNQLVSQWAAHSQSEKLKRFYKIIRTEYGYVQPRNKTEPCKAPVLRYPGFTDSDHAYFWDGACRGGFATGLGRLIARSVADHVEIILDLPQGSIPGDYLYWLRDYMGNHTEYGIDYASGESKVFKERIETAPLNISSVLSSTAAEGDYGIGNFKDLVKGERTTEMFSNPKYSYKKAVSADPSDPVAYTLSATNFKTGQELGAVGVWYKDGSHDARLAGGSEKVSVPDSYFYDMNMTLNLIPQRLVDAMTYVQKAKRLYETYAQSACARNSTDEILPDLYYQICTYDLRFRDRAAQLEQKIEGDRRAGLDPEIQQRLIKAKGSEAASSGKRVKAAEEHARAIDNSNLNLNLPAQILCSNFGHGITICSSF